MIDLLLLQELRKQIQEQLDENTQTADIVKLTLLLRLQRSYQSSTFSFRQRFEFLLVLFFQPSSLRCRSLRLIHDFVRLVALRTMPCGFNASLTQDVICKSHSLLTAFDAPPRLAQGFVFAVPATIKSNLVLYTMTYVIQCNVCVFQTAYLIFHSITPVQCGQQFTMVRDCTCLVLGSLLNLSAFQAVVFWCF